MIQDNQVKTLLGINTNNTAEYGNLTDITSGLIITADATINSFTLLSNTPFIIIPSITYPIYIDGSTYEAINGGIACGTTAKPVLTIDGVTPNIIHILDSNNNDVLFGVKKVFAMVHSSVNDGETTNSLLFLFVIWDSTTNQFITYELPTGEYNYQLNKIYNIGTAVLTGKLIGVPHGTINTQDVIVPTFEVSTDTDNKASVGSDNLVYVSGLEREHTRLHLGTLNEGNVNMDDAPLVNGQYIQGYTPSVVFTNMPNNINPSGGVTVTWTQQNTVSTTNGHQDLYLHDEGKVFVRTRQSDVWQPWIEVGKPIDDSGWLPLTLLSGWAKFDNTYSIPQYRKIANIVHLRGLMKGGVVTPYTIIATLPVEYRCLKQDLFVGYGSNGAYRLTINPDGNIKTGDNISATWASLSGIYYFVD